MKLNNNDDSHNSGLNLLIYNMLLDIESHPAWVCGLKLNEVRAIRMQKVTPCVGVWIETFAPSSKPCLYPVTPCVGVWIETLFLTSVRPNSESHPAWVCGLKQIGAFKANRSIESHPAWVCGLKQI